MTIPARILIVDDDPDILEFVSLALGDEGYDVRAACDGWNALEVCAEYPPDLILLDLRMPSMDGRQFAAAYGAGPGPQAPILLLTASKDANGMAGEAGVVGYLAKPFALDDLFAAVARHLRA